MNRLQTVVEKQRGQIKKLEQSNIEFKSDNEEVTLKFEISFNGLLYLLLGFAVEELSRPDARPLLLVARKKGDDLYMDAAQRSPYALSTF